MIINTLILNQTAFQVITPGYGVVEAVRQQDDRPCRPDSPELANQWKCSIAPRAQLPPQVRSEALVLEVAGYQAVRLAAYVLTAPR